MSTWDELTQLSKFYKYRQVSICEFFSIDIDFNLALQKSFLIICQVLKYTQVLSCEFFQIRYRFRIDQAHSIPA